MNSNICIDVEFASFTLGELYIDDTSKTPNIYISEISREEFYSLNNSNLNFPNGVYFGLFENEVLVGCIGVKKYEWESAKIYGLYVTPKKRGKGYGKRLVNHIINLYPNRLIYATVNSENTPSIKVFKACGFAIQKKITSPQGNQVYIITL
jgi:RimJ/RimL family protein N-acetyltransferase